MENSTLRYPGWRLLVWLAALVVSGNLTAPAKGVDPSPPATASTGGRIVASARQSELVYANNDADALFPPGRGWRIADDLWTTASCGCELDVYELTVGGGGDGTGPGFSVEFGLYDGCPNDGGAILPGTADSRTFEDDGVHVITFTYEGDPLALPGIVWLAVKFDDDDAGWFTGTPADVGFTADDYDHPTIHCTASFSGTSYWAGFAAKLYCTPAPPPDVVNPNPPDGAENLSTRSTLTWNGSRGSREDGSDDDAGARVLGSSDTVPSGDGRRPVAREEN